MRRCLLPLLALSCFLLGHGDVRADWPSARHDLRRTGGANGVSNIVSPGAYWRTYLGGVVGVAQGLPTVVAGERVLIFVSAGRVHAATPDGIPLWQSDNLSIGSLAGLADLDGDGLPEIVAQSTARAFAFDAATGSLRWAEDEGEMGVIGAVRVADVDGDGLAEIVVQECGCCQLNSGETGYVYGFADGFATPRRLWRLPYAFCGGSRSLLVDDLDGDGDADVLVGNNTRLEILDGTDGVSLASSPALGTWVAYSYCEAIDLDATVGKELVCVHGTELEVAGAGHRVFALRYASGPDRLELMWSTDIGERDEQLGIAAGFIRDLDGDGLLEVSVSGTLESGREVTVVLDALTGTVVTSLLDEIVVGTAPGVDGARLVTRSNRHLRVWNFDRASPAPLQLAWLIKLRSAVTTRDWTLAGKQALSNRLLLADADGDGVDDLVTSDATLPWQLLIQSLASGATVATWTGGAGADIVAGWGDADGRLVISTADGLLSTMTSALDAQLGDVRAGGYYASGAWFQLQWAPVAGDLDGDGADEVLIADSRKSLLALDVRDATNAGPPTTRWERTKTYAPSVVSGLGVGGTPAVACRRADLEAEPPTELVAVLDDHGEPVWETAVGSALVFEDVVTGNFDGDQVPDLAVQWGEADDLAIRTTAYAGANGDPLWTAVTEAGAARFPSGVAVSDWNGDGVDDIFFHHYGTRVLSGADGGELATGGPASAAYFMPTLADVAGDARLEITLQGGAAPNRTLSSDLTTTVWASDDDDRPYPYAAIASCPDGAVLVGSSLRHGTRLKVTQQSGANAGSWQSLVLADGARYADEAAAQAAGASLAEQLTSVHVHADLTGLGHPSAVVGSTDGWLYAIDPCTMGLDFAMPFGAPVGAVAFADGDGDGLDEIVVSTADGFLHGVRHQPIASPTEVRDVDPDSDSDVDVDEIATRGSLSAAWDAVPGADGYEVTVALAEGGIIAMPAWQRVEATFVTFASLPLDDGERYVFAVRALSAGGPSPDRLSDGVLVHLESTPDAGIGPDASDPGFSQPDGGCCQTGREAGGGVTVLSLLVFGAIRARRVRRR